ncbi:hypothetical protein GCM10010336_28970 [Streptomyces goshikiensis]|nr:hypothetical protein GCM10010336_28970 [Streptomyces goshikiensis]
MGDGTRPQGVDGKKSVNLWMSWPVGGAFEQVGGAGLKEGAPQVLRERPVETFEGAAEGPSQTLTRPPQGARQPFLMRLVSSVTWL